MEELKLFLTVKVKGVDVVCFMHELDVYVLLPENFLEKGLSVRTEEDILSDLREKFGREIRKVTLYIQYYN